MLQQVVPIVEGGGALVTVDLNALVHGIDMHC